MELNYTYKASKIYGNGIMYVNGYMNGAKFELSFKVSKQDKVNVYILATTTLDRDKYFVSYDIEGLSLLPKDSKEYELGQIVNHKSYGKGQIIEMNKTALKVNFNGEIKVLAKSIASNFLK